MQPLNDSADWPQGSPPRSSRTFGARLSAALKQAERAGTEHRALTTAIGLLVIVGLACVCLSVSRGPNFEFLYLFCCAVIGWLAGTRAGFASVVLSAFLLFAAEITRGQVSSVWIFVFDSVLRFLAFASITWLAARVGRESRELGRVVVQRTARLLSAEKEQEQTHELLLEATQLFRQVTENITDVFWVTDPSRREVEYISPGFERLWGRPCQDLYASPSAWVEGIYHEDRERVTRSMFTRQVSGEYDEEYRVVRTDGSIHWVHDRAFPVRDEGGAVYRLVGIAEDITERKRAEQLLRAERDVGAALSSTSDLQFALERLLEIALQLEGVDCGGVYLVDTRTGELELKAHRGLLPGFVERISRYKSDAIETRLANTGKVTYCQNSFKMSP